MFPDAMCIRRRVTSANGDLQQEDMRWRVGYSRYVATLARILYAWQAGGQQVAEHGLGKNKCQPLGQSQLDQHF